MSKQIPSFDRLPLGPDDPPYSAWGLWGEADEDPALGSLNHLTDKLVLRAAKDEIQTGHRVGLKSVVQHPARRRDLALTICYYDSLPLEFFNPPLLGRAGFKHEIIDKTPMTINDDVVCIIL